VSFSRKGEKEEKEKEDKLIDRGRRRTG